LHDIETIQLFDDKDAQILATVRETTLLASASAERTGLSRVAVSRRIKKLVEAGYLQKTGHGTRPTYGLGNKRFWLQYCNLDWVHQWGDETGVWELHVLPLLQGMPAHVVNLANIAFTEMLNNALDHSQAQALTLAVHLEYGRLQMVVADDGVGIFRQIARALHVFDDRLALLELAKGKFTTAPSGHSGMGVFVVSRMVDGFAIHSRGLTYDMHATSRPLAPYAWLPVQALYKAEGTVVRMDIALDTTRTAQDVYQRYFSPDEVGGEAFHTTEVPVRLAQLSSHLTSRSQGKWVVERATQFKTVILDFDGVSLVGQGFVDEVFRVFASAHPQVQLKPVNMTAEVVKMVGLFAPYLSLDADRI
jgi:anti-sigma regulatory factor (Ser/Thr protein kinase)